MTTAIYRTPSSYWWHTEARFDPRNRGLNEASWWSRIGKDRRITYRAIYHNTPVSWSPQRKRAWWEGIGKNRRQKLRGAKGVLDTAKDAMSIYRESGVTFGDLALPTDQLFQQGAKLRAQAEAKIKGEATKVATQVGNEIISATNAQKIAGDVLKNMNLPTNIPVQLPATLTPSGVADAAYSTGRVYAEELIKKETGIPIQLPKKLTVKELERSLIGSLPKNAEEVIDLGLAIGSQYAASAITSLVAGATIGSVVPGLGTVVGIGVALGVAEAKKLVKSFDRKSYVLRKCNGVMPYWTGTCPSLPQLAPLELIPWAQTQLVPIRKSMAQETSKRWCGTGPVVDCDNWLGSVKTQAARLSEGTPAILGLPQVNRLIPIYEAAPKTYEFFSPRKKQIIIESFDTKLLEQLRARKVVLDSLVTQMSNVSSIPAKDVASLRWLLVTEMRNAAVQLQFNPSSENQQWLSQLGRYYQALTQREAAESAAMARRSEEQKRIWADVQKDPSRLAKHERDMLLVQCSGGDEGACAKLKAQGTTLRPQTTAPAPASTATATEAQVRAAGLALLNSWIKNNVGKSTCLTPQIRNQLLDLFVAAHAKKTISVEVADKQIKSILDNLCKPTSQKPAVVKRTDQKVAKLQKELVELRKKAEGARIARTKAQQAIRTKDAQRQQAAKAGLTPAQQAAVTAQAQAQTAAAVSQANAAAKTVASQHAAVQRAAQAAGVPMTAVQQALTKTPIPAPVRPVAPVPQRSFTTQPFWTRGGAEPAQPAIPTERPDLFSSFFRR